MNDRRLQVVASIGTRLALGAYPLAFIVAFGWAYGKQAFDIAAAAINWANYLNVFLLSGFALVPPAVARLRGDLDGTDADRALLRDHLALARWLLAAAGVAALALWATIDRAFPGLAGASAQLASWFVLFAVAVASQLPLTLWLGVAQATGRYTGAFLSIAGPRALALLAVLGSAHLGASATVGIALAVGIVIAGQAVLGRVARNALREVDRHALEGRGHAGKVLRTNLSAGSIALVGTMVTIVPVTVVGHWRPEDVGLAHVAVTVSNAIGAMIVAAFFPASLTLAQRAHDPNAIQRHSARIARRVALATAAAVALAWLVLPLCVWLVQRCGVDFYALMSFVLLGAGLRLTALGPYHAALAVGRPHLALPSALAEALIVVGGMLAFTPLLGLHAMGVVFVAGGGVRALVALTLEVRRLSARGRVATAAGDSQA